MLGKNSRFCLGCGAATSLPISGGSKSFVGRPYLRPLAFGTSCLALIATAVLFGLWSSGAFDGGLSGSNGKADSPALHNPPSGNVSSHSPKWFASYEDKFFSGPVITYAKTATEKRNFPTTRGTMTLGAVAEGAMLDGRYVAGGDGLNRWFKTVDGTYIPGAALSATPRTVEGAPSNGFVVSNIRFGRTVQADGQLADLVANHVLNTVPITVNFQLDYTNALPFQPYVCQLRERSRITIGTFNGVLQTPGGWIRCGFNITAPGIYEAVLTTANANFWLGSFRVTNLSGG